MTVNYKILTFSRPANKQDRMFSKNHSKRNHPQKQPLADVPRKTYSENVQQIYRRTPMSKCDFNKVALLHIFRTPFLKNNIWWLLLHPAPKLNVSLLVKSQVKMLIEEH